jgi:hypothetical protein
MLLSKLRKFNPKGSHLTEWGTGGFSKKHQRLPVPLSLKGLAHEINFKKSKMNITSDPM